MGVYYYHAKFEKATANCFGDVVFTISATEQKINKKYKKTKDVYFHMCMQI